MDISPAQIHLIRKSYGLLAANQRDLVTALFYSRLFALNPLLRVLFYEDMQTQCQKFTHMLMVLVGVLDQVELLVPTIEALGERHFNYGVLAEDYEVLGVALLWALKEVLKDKFTPDVYDAWLAAYEMIASIAKSDLYNPEPGLIAQASLV